MEFDDFLQMNGIQRKLTVPYTLEQNGVAERKNRTLAEMARCMMIQSKLPPSFWAEAISTANYLRNRCTSESIDGETPFKLWTGKRPTVTHLRPFGTKALVLDKSQQRGKFEPKSKECILIGYSEESKAYRLWLTIDKKVIRSRDVKFMNTFQPEENGTISTTDHNSLLDPLAEEGEASRSDQFAEEG